MAIDPQKIQQQYEQWHALITTVETATQQLAEAEILWKDLQDYYHSEQWMQDHEHHPNVECGANHYSVLGEDTLWNALEQRRQLALQLMRASLNILES